MTAMLKTFTVHYVSLGNVTQPLAVTKDGPHQPVVLHLGNGHVIEGNRPEDFQTLKDACDKALAFFEEK